MDTSPHTPAEIRRWAHERRPHERESVPAVGERLLLRQADFGEPVPAVVTAVMDMSSPHDHWRRHGDLERAGGPGTPDPHVWRYDEQQDRHVLADDPWPWVQAAVIRFREDGGEWLDGEGNPVTGSPSWCREARVRGSAGWLREGSRAHTGNYEGRR